MAGIMHLPPLHQSVYMIAEIADEWSGHVESTTGSYAFFEITEEDVKRYREEIEYISDELPGHWFVRVNSDGVVSIVLKMKPDQWKSYRDMFDAEYEVWLQQNEV